MRWVKGEEVRGEEVRDDRRGEGRGLAFPQPSLQK